MKPFTLHLLTYFNGTQYAVAPALLARKLLLLLGALCKLLPHSVRLQLAHLALSFADAFFDRPPFLTLLQ